MGYTFNENHAETKWRGEVVYRKRNIRTKWQSRQLKINRPNKHIYFDDDGVQIPNPIDKVRLFDTFCNFVIYYIFCIK